MKHTSSYVADYGGDVLDLRNRFMPNRWSQEVLRTERMEAHPYEQVFQNKTGFLHNLSVLDLLFNEGPQASEVIRIWRRSCRGISLFSHGPPHPPPSGKIFTTFYNVKPKRLFAYAQ